MGEAGKKISLVKPIALKPFSFRDAGPSFQVWEGLLNKGLGDAEGSTNPNLDLKLGVAEGSTNPNLDLKLGNAEGRTNPNLDLKLGIADIYSAQAALYHCNNHTLDQAEENLINGGLFATPSVGISFNTNQNYEGQASKPAFDLKMPKKTEDPRLKGILRNRIYSRRYRMKKMHYMDHLEKLTNDLASSTCFYFSVEIEKNKAEVNRLRELQFNQLQAKQNATRNSDDGLHAVKAQLDLNF
ncbi:uncharacterized protein LOC109814778 [Cajanus cajan]|uniref:uncharacterized protein LOC109814778 n=1 Tax=Cajanus cajan TaxID=3821 RepID=UPI00098DCBC3|nr:uncharacterized protein LOC109814778 [Cajanus cajan]